MKVELFYDIVSPYSYLAFEVFCRYRALWDTDLVLRPAFLGGVMKATGNVPPATLPQRAPYLLRDVHRTASFFDVKLGFPSEFPGNTLAAMRLLTVVEREKREKLVDLSRALWQRHWGRDDDIKTPAGLVAGCVEAGIPQAEGEKLVERTGDPAIKEALKAATDEVVARGAFGFPAFFVKPLSRGEGGDGDEMFFGSDRFELLAHMYGLPWRGPKP